MAVPHGRETATLERVVGFEWDAGNSRKSADRHDMSQAEAEQVFFNDPLVLADSAHSGSEARFQALGRTDEARPLHVTFTLRQDGVTHITGIWNSAPALIPVGQRDVIAFSFV
jgi:uncharacterized DUF497 family protein